MVHGGQGLYRKGMKWRVGGHKWDERKWGNRMGTWWRGEGAKMG